MLVLGPVEVGRAGGEQPARLARLVQQQRLLARVLGVEALDAVEPLRREALDRAQHLVRVVDVPERVRPHRHAAGGVDDLDRLLDGRPRARDVRLRARHQVGREQLLLPANALAREPLGVVRVREHGVGEMRPPDALAVHELVVVEREAELAQAVGHRQDAAAAVGAEVLQRRQQCGVGGIDLVAEDVEVLVLAVHARELRGGREPDPVLPRGGRRLGDPGHGVVIGEREQFDARGGGARDHLGGRQRPVRVRRVRLQVERRGVSGH